MRNKIKGWIDYINSIEPELAKNLYELFNIIEKVENEKRMKENEKNKLKNGNLVTLKLEIKEPIHRKK